MGTGDGEEYFPFPSRLGGMRSVTVPAAGSEAVNDFCAHLSEKLPSVN